MKILLDNLTREEMSNYSKEGYILFDASTYIDDQLDTKELFLAKEDDILWKTNGKIIALNEVRENNVLFELFDEENYSQEEIFDKLGEYLSYEVNGEGKIIKTSIKFRRNY